MRTQITKVLHRAEHTTHFVYFGSAAVGSHHAYAICAGIICAIMVLGIVLHTAEA